MNSIAEDGFTLLIDLIMSMSVLIEGEKEENELINSFDELLKRKDLNINARDENGNTVLHLASMFHNHTIVRKLLANPSVDLFILNKDNQTAADCANKCGARHIAKTIHEYMIRKMKWNIKLIKTISDHNLANAKKYERQ